MMGHDGLSFNMALEPTTSHRPHDVILPKPGRLGLHRRPSPKECDTSQHDCIDVRPSEGNTTEGSIEYRKDPVGSCWLYTTGGAFPLSMNQPIVKGDLC